MSNISATTFLPLTLLLTSGAGDGEPDGASRSGNYQATFAWNSRADKDLHLFEPGGPVILSDQQRRAH